MFTNIWSHITSQNAPWTLSCLPSFSFYTHMLLSGLLISYTVVQSFVLMVQPGIMSIKASKSSNCQSPKINGPYSRSAHFRTRFFKLLCLKKIALSMLRKLPSKKKKKSHLCFWLFCIISPL